MGKAGLLVVLSCVAILGCGSSDDGLETMAEHDLRGDWLRAGSPECEGPVELRHLPIDQRFINTDRLEVEQDGDWVIFVDFGDGFNGTLDGDNILPELAYGVIHDADYDPNFPYDEVWVHRRIYVDDAMQIVFEDVYELSGFGSRGHELSCRHVFELHQVAMES